MAKTIAQVAAEYSLDPEQLVRAYARHDKRCKTTDFIPPRPKLLRRCLLELGTGDSAPAGVDPGRPLPPGVRLDSVRDRLSDRLNLPERSRFTIHLHQRLLEALQGDDLKGSGLERRLSLVVQHLACHGRTSIVKGCNANGNEGWRRTPLGGRGGMQFYLWWAPAGAPPVAGLPGTGDEIYIRDVRHHDQHATLPGGTLEEYLTLSPAEIDSQLPSPLTAGQQEFCRSEAPVRMLAGNPGVGKTTSLWNSLSGRDGERVLYLTWSRQLCRQAREYFDSFGPANSTIEIKTVAEFVASLTGVQVTRAAAERGYELFCGAVSRLPSSTVGAWGRHRRQLYEEVRAHFLGALPRFTAMPDGFAEFVRPDMEFVKSRTRTVGANELLDLTRIIKAIATEPPGEASCLGTPVPASGLGDYFPDLEQARYAYCRIAALSRAGTAGDLIAYDRIVVDELQDLTALEYGLILYAARLGAQEGVTPFIVVAGDEGQTVVPTDFRWADFKNGCRLILQPPEEHLASVGLRSPKNLDMIAEYATDLYGVVEKERRPRALSRVVESEAVSGRLINVVGTADECAEILDFLADRPLTIVTAASADDLQNLPKSARRHVLLPEQVKGLEAQTVVVVNPALTLKRLRAKGRERDRFFDGAQKRRLLDGFRVALSRSAETLVLLDAEPDAAAVMAVLELCRQVGRDAAVTSVFKDDFLALMNAEDNAAGAEEMIQSCLSDVGQFLEDRPQQALMRADQAAALLGEEGMPGSVSDPTLRREVLETRVAAALAAQMRFGANPHERAKDPRYGSSYLEAAEAAAGAGCSAAARMFEFLASFFLNQGDRGPMLPAFAALLADYPEPSRVALPQCCTPFAGQFWEDVYYVAASALDLRNFFLGIGSFTVAAARYGEATGRSGELARLLSDSLAVAMKLDLHPWVGEVLDAIDEHSDDYFAQLPANMRESRRTLLASARTLLESKTSFTEGVKHQRAAAALDAARSAGRFAEACELAAGSEELARSASPSALVLALRNAEAVAKHCETYTPAELAELARLMESLATRLAPALGIGAGWSCRDEEPGTDSGSAGKGGCDG